MYKQENNLFTLNSALDVFKQLEHPDYWISEKKIHDSFVLSLITIIDETKRENILDKYLYLNYVEFLELICRITLTAIKI